MTMARKNIVPPGVERTYHCIARCVRRAYLCGKDRPSGKNFEHRKQWVKDRLRILADVFAIDVCGYAVMNNHIHLVLRTAPTRAAQWSPDEIARRWLVVFPRKTDSEDGTPDSLQAQLVMPKRLECLRERLCSLSWFMRCFDEFLARKANAEDGCKGRFWEGRFKSQALLDEAAILACMAYVDLNPIRAEAAKTPEESEFTSVQDRIRGCCERQELERLGQACANDGKSLPEQTFSDSWLLPIGHDQDHKRCAVSMKLEEYLALIDWSGRELHKGKRGKIPDHLAPIFERLQLNQDNWFQTVEQFGGWFSCMVGRYQALVMAARSLGRRWLKGLRPSRVAFGTYESSSGAASS